MAVKTMNQAEAREALAAEEKRRVRAARQAAKVEQDAIDAPLVQVRVLPMGDGKISMGEHFAGIGEVHYEKGETFSVADHIAAELEARGFVETVSGG